jgi:hypothetical protein
VYTSALNEDASLHQQRHAKKVCLAAAYFSFRKLAIGLHDAGCAHQDVSVRYALPASQSKLYDSPFRGYSYRMSAIRYTQFHEDILHVPLHRFFGDTKFSRDPFIGIAGCRVLKHLNLSVTQRLVDRS